MAASSRSERFLRYLPRLLFLYNLSSRTKSSLGQTFPRVRRARSGSCCGTPALAGPGQGLGAGAAARQDATPPLPGRRESTLPALLRGHDSLLLTGKGEGGSRAGSTETRGPTSRRGPSGGQAPRAPGTRLWV